MNEKEPVVEQQGTITDTELSDQLVVLPDNVYGRIHCTIMPLNGGSQEVVARLEDGREMVIPLDLLKLREDGAYDLPCCLDELKIDRHTIERSRDLVVPVVQEELTVGKRQVETGRVRITKRVKTREEVVDEPLYKQEVEVVRVPVNQVVAEPPQPRQEGDTMIVPVVEEVLVVEKRLMLKEELHIRQRRVETHQPQRVVLRSEEVAVERVTANSPASVNKGDAS